MAIEVLITARVRIEREAFENCLLGTDIALSAATYILRELPNGMTFVERTARITAITPEPAVTR